MSIASLFWFTRVVSFFSSFCTGFPPIRFLLHLVMSSMFCSSFKVLNDVSTIFEISHLAYPTSACLMLLSQPEWKKSARRKEQNGTFPSDDLRTPAGMLSDEVQVDKQLVGIFAVQDRGPRPAQVCWTWATFTQASVQHPFDLKVNWACLITPLHAGNKDKIVFGTDSARLK